MKENAMVENLKLAIWAMKRDGRKDLIEVLAQYGAIPLDWASDEPIIIDSSAIESAKRLDVTH